MRLLVAVLGLLAITVAPAFAAWEPTKQIEFVVPAGTGGGGAEGFLHVKGKKGDAHTIIITLSNLFTTPLHTGVPFSWKDLTPIARLALDEFILWVSTTRPDAKEFKTAKEYSAAVKERSSGERMSMGGTGSA